MPADEIARRLSRPVISVRRKINKSELNRLRPGVLRWEKILTGDLDSCNGPNSSTSLSLQITQKPMTSDFVWIEEYNDLIRNTNRQGRGIGDVANVISGRAGIQVTAFDINQ